MNGLQSPYRFGAGPSSGQPASPEGRPALIAVTDALDVAGSGPLLDQARSLARQHHSLLISLERAPFIDSDGVRALLQLAKEFRETERELRLVVTPGSRVERTLRLLRLEMSLPIYPTLEEARSPDPVRSSWDGVLD